MSEDILLNENLKLLAVRNNTWIGSFFVFAVVVENSISQKYESLGGSAFGEIERKEFAVWYLKNGACICYNADKQQSFEIHGAIYQKWADYGGINWGVPSTDETKTPDGVGRFNHFEKGQSIYWTPSTGAHVIYGAIKEHWASLGWEKSFLGYPITDESDLVGVANGRFNNFEHGQIAWSPTSGANVSSTTYRPNGVSGIRPLGLPGDGAPVIRRRVVASAHMDITDDETFGSNEHGSSDGQSEGLISSYIPRTLLTLVGKAGGEVRVELNLDASVIGPEGDVMVTGTGSFQSSCRLDG
jgi:LGFP repeat